MPEQIFCNKCGKTLDIFDRQEDFSITKERLGYGTKFDGDKLKLHLCCDCLEELVNGCKVSPIYTND